MFSQIKIKRNLNKINHKQFRNTTEWIDIKPIKFRCRTSQLCENYKMNDRMKCSVQVSEEKPKELFYQF